jgi:hypothetical protein
MNEENLFGVTPEPEQTFSLPDGEVIAESRLRSAERQTQIDVMRHWFYENYEDPVENTPYISAEGGYQYIWGGPYDAEEELEETFIGIVPDDVIKELAEELWHVSAEWSRRTRADIDLDDYLFRSISEARSPLEPFQSSIINIRRLMEITVEPADRQCLLRLLYVNVITALETYLSDTFIQRIADPKRLRMFVETTPEFQKEKIPLSDVFNAHDAIKAKVEAHLLEFVWHRLEKVKPMFHDTLGIEFPPDMNELFTAVVIRHDLVHRNGRKKDGQEHILNESIIEALIHKAEGLVSAIESQQKLAES